MTIKEIANNINAKAFDEKRLISKLQEIRAKHLKSRPNTWGIFSEKSIKVNENYAFHSGGRNEFQFNIGHDNIKNLDVFRYGLAFSLEKGQGMFDPENVFEPKIKKFNDFVKSNITFFDGYFMWIYSSNGKFIFFEQVNPIRKNFVKEGNFIFIGKYIEKDITAIDNDDINEFLNSFDHLIEAYEKVEFGKIEIEKRIARLIWNDNGWVKPSGLDGKSEDKETHEGKYGYGHEEWLFDTSKLIDGFHYGFLEPIRKEQQAYFGKKFNVWVYTIDKKTKKRYWIGEINEIDVIDNDEAERIKGIYIDKGWHKEMQNQIMESGANANGFSDWNGVDLFNIKYIPKNLKLNDSYFELPKEHKVYKQHRYNFEKYSDKLELLNKNKAFTFDAENEEKDTKNDSIASKTYTREPKAIEVTYVHKAISDVIKTKLKEKFGNKNVKTEVNAGYGNNKIDLVVKHQDEFIFYEIKSYNSSRTSIREALGQLLEYCSWTNSRNATKLIVVSQLLGDTEDAKTYIKHIRVTYGIPIYFQTFDLTSKELSEEY
jgi:hypothetical protein